MGVVGSRVNRIVALYPFLDKLSSPATSTLAAAVLAGATTATVAAASTFANGQTIRLGIDEDMEAVTIASGGGTTSLVFTKAVKKDHASGDAVVEQSVLSLGLPEAKGFNFRVNGETVDVYTAISRLAYGVLTGYVDMEFEFQFPTVTVDAIAFALGLPRSQIVGDGTAVAQTGTAGPRLLTTDGSTFGQITGVNMAVVVQLNNGAYQTLWLYNLSFDPTAFALALQRGTLTTVPVKGMASHAAIDQTNSLFVPASTLATYAPSSADIISELTNMYVITDSGTSTTTTAAIAPNAYVIPVTSGTGITGNVWLKLGTGDTAEWHKVQALATLNANLFTQVQGTFASGAAVTLQTLTPVADLIGGVNLAINGNVKTNRAELYRTSIGKQVETASAVVTTKVGAFTQANLLLALGLQASDVTSSVIPLGKRLATAPPFALLMTGLTQGQRNVSICGWRAAVQLSNDLAFGAQVDTTPTLTYKPAALQFMINV